MSTIYLFRVYCTTQEEYEYVWAKTTPTVCSVDGDPILHNFTTSINSFVLTSYLNITNVNSPYIPGTENEINADTSSGSIIINLPDLTLTDNVNRTYFIQKTDAANIVTVNAFGGQTIGGLSSKVLTNLNGTLFFCSDGISDWITSPTNIIIPTLKYLAPGSSKIAISPVQSDGSCVINVNVPNLINDSGSSTSDLWSASKIQSEIGGGGSSTLSSLQVRRSTTYALTTEFVSLTFDLTDIETDDVSLKHNDTTTSRIDVLAAGTYLISYNCISSMTSTQQTYSGRLYKNGTTLITGSDSDYVMKEATNSEYRVYITRSCIHTFSASDYFEFQVKATTTGETIQTNAIINVVKLDGVQGGQGPPGTPGTNGVDGDITWQGAWSSVTAYTTNQAVTHNGTSYVCISNNTNQVPPNAIYWDVLASKGDTGTTSYTDTISVHPHNGTFKSEILSTYTTQAHMSFLGTTVSTPLNIYACISASASIGTHGWRIYDTTNSLVICENTTATNTALEIVDLGTLSNLSSGAAVWDIQMKGDGSRGVNIGSVIVKY